MNHKKQIISMMTLIVLLLLMMSTTIQAVSIGKVNNVNATMNGNQMKLTWSSISNAKGYSIYVNDTRIGAVNSNQATLIGFSENVTYRFKISAYDYQNRELAVSEEFKFTTTALKTLGQVQNLTVTQSNGFVTLNWSEVKNANKYQIFVDVPGFGNMNIGEVETTNVMLQNFIKGKRYGFSVRACQTLSSGNTNYGEKAVMQYCTIGVNEDNNDTNNNNNTPQVEQVYNVSVYDITDTTATISWAKTNNADGYEVLLSKNYGSYQNVLDTYGTVAYLSNLTQNSYYRVKVIAYKKQNGKKVYGKESSYQDFTTKTTQITVGQATNVNVYNVTDTVANIYWTKANNADGYEVLLSKNYGNYQTILDTYGTAAYLSNLTQNSYYRVKVIAYKLQSGKKVYGQESSYQDFTTKATQVTVGKVTNLNLNNITKNSCYVSWTSTGTITGYDIYVCKGEETFKYWGTTTAKSYTLNNLSENTYYQVEVKPYVKVNGKKYTEDSLSKGFRTLKTENIIIPAKVTHLNVQVKNQKEAYLTWWPVDKATGYEVLISTNGSEYKSITYVNTTSTILTNSMLNYSTNYKVKVRAYTNQYINYKRQSVWGECSDAVSFRTENYNYVQDNPTLEKVGTVYAPVVGDRVYLSWNSVKGATGYEIDFYVPGIGNMKFDTNTNSKTISGLNDISSNSYYTARVRAYKYVNGAKQYGLYSDIVRFKAK